MEIITLQRLIKVSNVLFLHWNAEDMKKEPLKSLRDFALKMGLRVVIFIEN